VHTPSSLLFLLLIPLIIWNVRRRLHRVRKNADHWFQPSGENFIYHPRGRWGQAFLISAADRETIKRKMTGLWIGIFSGFALIYIVPLLLAIGDLDHYMDYRRQMIGYRIGAVAFILMAGLIWHRLTIWPIYASAERSAERISIEDVRSKIAASTSWVVIVGRIVLFALLLASLIAAVWFQPPSPTSILYVVIGLFCVWGLVEAIRLARTKSRL